jgi:prevent-host-death family protein
VGGVEQTGIEEARRGLGEIVDRARLKGEAVMITRAGKPAAVVVPVEWYKAAGGEAGTEHGIFVSAEWYEAAVAALNGQEVQR